LRSFPKCCPNFSLLQDEDFIASENGTIDSDGEASDSDESLEEGSDAENEEDGDDPALPDLPAELQATLRQALEGEKVLDEPILSDSEISREFPEEEDDVFGALAGSDFDAEEDEDATSGATGSEGSAQDVRRAASTIAAAQSAAAAAAVTDRGGRPTTATAMGLSPTATGRHRRTRFGEEALSEQGFAGPQLIPLSPLQGDCHKSPPMEVFGAMLPSLGDNNDGATSRPIARRTRAHVSLMDVTIEELEDKLAPATSLNEPLLYFGVDDAAEWERFIAGLQTSLDYGVHTAGAGGGASLLGGAGVLGTNTNTNGVFNNGVGTNAGTWMDTEFEDSDDEDFVLELQRMLEEDEAMRLHHGFDIDLGVSLPDDFFNYNHGGGGGGKSYGGGGGGRGKHHGNSFRGDGGPRTRSGGRSKKRRRIAKPPRRSARLLGSTIAERPLFMASLMDRRTGKATAAALQQGIDALPALQQAYGPSINAQAPLHDGLNELATLAAALATGPPIPLPSDMGKPGTLAAARNVVWRAPLPKAMRKYDLSAQPDESAPIIGAHFQASQYSDLYLSMHYHVQLLEQTTAMAVAINDTESAEAGAQLLRKMEQFVTNQTNSRRSAGIPAYVSACLGIDTGEGLGEEEKGPQGIGSNSGSGSGIDSSGASGSRLAVGHYSINRRWTPQNPGNIYTVADVCVLRAASRMLDLLPNIGGGGVISAEAILTTARTESPVSSPELENRQPVGPSSTRTGAEENKKRRKRGKQPSQHLIWSELPADITRALLPVRRFFNPEIEPMPPNFNVTSQMLFTPAEDDLLAWGIRKHLYDWAKISAELLPAKDEKVIFNRKKNRCSSAAPSNIVKEVVSLITGELTLPEQELIVQALGFYGKQPKKWEMICKEHLPLRHPKVLSMKWSDRQKEICAGTGGHVVTDVATVTAAAAAMPRANQGLVMRDEDAAAASAAADQMLAERMAHQEQYPATQQWAAAAIGAGVLPPLNASTAAAGAMPQLPQLPGWIAIPQDASPAPMQQQLFPGAAEAATGLALPRLVEWELQPGQVEEEQEQQQQQQPRAVPPRNPASQILDELIGRAAGAETATTAAVWSEKDDKAVLLSALQNGGELKEQQLEEFQNTLKRSKEDISARCKVLVERFLKAKQERQRQ